jgi:hypothetical protein
MESLEEFSKDKVKDKKKNMEDEMENNGELKILRKIK